MNTAISQIYIVKSIEDSVISLLEKISRFEF